MKFWIAKCTCAETGVVSEHRYASDENQQKPKIKKDILSTNPQYSKVSLKKAPRPKWWILFEGKIGTDEEV